MGLTSMNLPSEQRRIFFAAGEISGDMQAAYLAATILRQNPHVRLHGCGGERMKRAGVDVQIETAQLGYVGFHEPARFRRPLREVRSQIKSLLRAERPDLAVLVDGDRFNRFLINYLYEEGIPFVQYFAPLVIFWGGWRTRQLARRATLVIPAFPSEVNLFRLAGARTEWFGHPLCETVTPGSDPARALRVAGLDPNRPVIALMPGSRWHEIASFLPTVITAAVKLRRHRPSLQFVLPVAAPHLRQPIIERLKAAGIEDAVTLISDDVYPCLSQCELVLLASGTATLEIALLGVPMVVFYRVPPLTYLAARMLVRTKFIATPNIILDRAVVPELIQGDFTSDRLCNEALALLENNGRRQTIRNDLAEVRNTLRGHRVLERAATKILKLAGAHNEEDTGAKSLLAVAR